MESNDQNQDVNPLVEQAKQNREAQAKNREKVGELQSLVGATDAVQNAVIKSTELNIRHRDAHEPKVEVKNLPPDLAKAKDVTSVVDAINKLNLTTFTAAQPTVADMTERLTQLVNQLSLLSEKMKEAGFEQVSSSVSQLLDKISSLPKQLSDITLKTEQREDEKKLLEGIKSSLDGINFQPKVQPKIDVKAPEVIVSAPDLSPLREDLQQLLDAFQGFKIPETKLDLGPVTSAVSKVQSSIENLSFPIPNFVLPFKDSTGKATQVQLDSMGNITFGASRDQLTNQQTTITSSVAETTIVTADTTYFLDLYGLILTNTSATATKVTIKDTTSGTTRMVFQVPATDTRGFMLPVNAGHKQAAVNNNWTVTCGTSIASLEVTALINKRL